MKKILATILICISLYSCSNLVSKHELTSRVKADINAWYAKQASIDKISYTINGFTLVHKEGNEYSGILETTEDGENFSYEVSVTTDGDSYIWEILE